MARRRRFYARDTHGRFARVNGSRGVYKRRMSTRKKIAIAGAGAVAVGVAAYGGRELYRSGARKGYDVGKKHGLYEGKPLRGSKGRIRPNSEKKDTSQNPFARGKRPQRHGLQRARNRAGIGTRMRATNVAMHRVDQNFAQGRRRTEGFHATKRARNARHVAGRSVSQSLARARSMANRYNDAQARSQAVNGAKQAASTARRHAANAKDNAALRGMYAADRAKARAGRTVAPLLVTRHLRTTRPSAGRRNASPFGPTPSAYSTPFTSGAQRVSGGVKVGKQVTKRRHAKSRKRGR